MKLPDWLATALGLGIIIRHGMRKAFARLRAWELTYRVQCSLARPDARYN